MYCQELPYSEELEDGWENSHSLESSYTVSDELSDLYIYSSKLREEAEDIKIKQWARDTRRMIDEFIMEDISTNGERHITDR